MLRLILLVHVLTYKLTNMKKIIITVFCLSFLAVSCKDMLIEKPIDRLSQTTFYKTAEDANSAINAIYSPLRSTYGSFGGVLLTAVSDYSSGQGVFIPIAAYQGYPSSITGQINTLWNNLYQSVNMANIALKYIPDIDMEETNKNYLLGEAHFLRALSYNALVKSWGGVPIRKEPTEGLDNLGGKRASVEEVYAFLIEDLKFAETNLPSKQTLIGKPTKWTAKTMLADVYLTIEDFPNARDKADEVIQSGAYALVPVVVDNDFEKIFGPTVISSSEDVFSFKYTRTDGNIIPLFYSMPNSAYSSRGYGTFFGFPTYPLLRDWDHNDLRYQFNIYTSYPDKSGNIVQNSAAQPIRFGKFKDPGYAPSHGNNYPIYRYPDALFIYAEAATLANNAPTSLALERLNMIHRRAYGYEPTTPSPADFTLAGHTVSTFRDLILMERAYEFLTEGGKRWFDLIRTGTVKEVIKEAKGIDVADAHLLFPIPLQEIENNPDIDQKDQNPGY